MPCGYLKHSIDSQIVSIIVTFFIYLHIDLTWYEGYTSDCVFIVMIIGRWRWQQRLSEIFHLTGRAYRNVTFAKPQKVLVVNVVTRLAPVLSMYHVHSTPVFNSNIRFVH